PKNVLVSNSLEAIYRCITPSRREIFTCLVEKKPANLTELAPGKEIRPIALYERVVFDLKVNKELPPHGLILQANL
ncbi:6482_t:CDS:2, partial [Ambispora gerdemannii]